MQFQVPQFIETEDKIVGPLSLRQFFYIGAGVGISGLLYFVLQTTVWIIFAIVLIGGSAALAFVKIQGRPLVKVIFSAFNFYWSPQTYVWQPEHPQMQMAKEEKPEAIREGVVKKLAQGVALHKTWETVQTGEKMSNAQFAENKMYGRYQIFQKMEGDRRAARRVDYR